jgi:hypothetical protein
VQAGPHTLGSPQEGPGARGAAWRVVCCPLAAAAAPPAGLGLDERAGDVRAAGGTGTAAGGPRPRGAACPLPPRRPTARRRAAFRLAAQGLGPAQRGVAAAGAAGDRGKGRAGRRQLGAGGGRFIARPPAPGTPLVGPWRRRRGRARGPWTHLHPEGRRGRGGHVQCWAARRRCGGSSSPDPAPGQEDVCRCLTGCCSRAPCPSWMSRARPPPRQAAPCDGRAASRARAGRRLEGRRARALEARSAVRTGRRPRPRSPRRSRPRRPRARRRAARGGAAGTGGRRRRGTRGGGTRRGPRHAGGRHVCAAAAVRVKRGECRSRGGEGTRRRGRREGGGG